MKLVIRRKKWVRGFYPGGTYLRNEDGTKCCLGFFANALGIKSDRITRVGEPIEVSSSLWPKWLVPHTSIALHADSECAVLIGLNDDGNISEKEREKKIAAIFKKHGVEVVYK